MPVDVASLLSPEGPIARRLTGFEPRPQQREMALATERAMAAGGRLLVEAGTGVGKSFAYLLPAIKRIVENHERVVIATNTINLQEQLVDKDIPLLNAVIPEEFSAVLVKGRGNYVSLRRLKLASERQDRLFADDEARHSLHQIEDWAYSTRDGSLATLPQLSRPVVWDYAQSDSHNCMGKKCPTYKQCFYQAARRRMENGDLLVCNHALFFSDLALRMVGAGFLPPYDHVILDEAHCVEEIAIDHFGVSLTEGQVSHLLGLLYQPRTSHGFLATLQLKDGAHETVDKAIEQSLRCRNRAEELFDSLWRWQQEIGPSNGRITGSAVVPNVLSEDMTSLAAQLKLLKDRAATEADAFELNSYAQRCHDIAAAAKMLVNQEIGDCVYWLESGSGGGSSRRAGRKRSRGRERISLYGKPIDVSSILREHLFGGEISVVLTSATLATAPGDFTHISARLGCDGAETLQLGSPFDHAAQVELLVDRSMPDPGDPRYVDELCPRIEKQVRATDGGAFVLFTSFETLDAVAERLRPVMIAAGFPVLVHGQDGPPGLLLKRFRDDERSVLLGTNSFWQGVDVRGRGLRNVIITRLPFEVPDRPLVQARNERIKERGGDPFMEDQVPKAVIRFRQGFGRLIRSKADSGRVVVLDPRIVNKRYGRLFLAALPEGVEVAAADVPGA